MNWPRSFVILLYQSAYLKYNSCYTPQYCSFRYTTRSVHVPYRVQLQQQTDLKQQKILKCSERNSKFESNCDTDQQLVAANVWERLLVSRQETCKFSLERFGFKTLYDVEVREKVTG